MVTEVGGRREGVLLRQCEARHSSYLSDCSVPERTWLENWKGPLKKKWELRWWLLREQGETKNSKQLGVPGTKYEGVTRPVQWAEQKSSEGHSGVAERERQEWGSPGGSGRAETNRKGRGGGRRPSLKVDEHGNPSEESSLRNLGFQWPASGH